MTYRSSGGYYRPTRVPVARPGVSRALAGAITAARVGDPAPEPGQRSGTLDRTRLARIATGDCRVFVSHVTPGPRNIRAIVLLDGSSSMTAPLDTAASQGLYATGGVEAWKACVSRADTAAQVGLDLAGAFALMPNVKGAVYAHNVNTGSTTIHALWQTGEPIAYAGDYANLDLDSNNDEAAIAYCTDDLLDSRRPGEALVLVVVSDGAPPDEQAVKAQVDSARKRGVHVVSVAIGEEASGRRPTCTVCATWCASRPHRWCWHGASRKRSAARCDRPHGPTPPGWARTHIRRVMTRARSWYSSGPSSSPGACDPTMRGCVRARRSRGRCLGPDR